VNKEEEIPNGYQLLGKSSGDPLNGGFCNCPLS